jgi:hypothetical protein
MQSASVEGSGRTRRGLGASIAPALAAALAAAASCSSPESFHAGRSGLSTGGAGGVAGAAGGGAGAGATGGAGVAGDGALGGVSGDDGGTAGSGGSGAAGGAGSDAAGADGGAAGAGGAAGTGTADDGGAGTGAAGTSGAAGAAGSGGGAADAGAAGAGGTAPPPGPLALPVTVSDHFRPTGGMGDAVVAGAVTIGNDATACAGEPAAASQGDCYTVTYHPQPIVAPATTTWAGFYWQYPDDNWGTMAPLTIASGAKDVSFYAKGKAGGESITFEAGGILNQVSMATPYTDGFTVTMTFKLTNVWAKYTLPMTGLTYAGGVLGGFAWVASAPNTNAITFYLHGIVWE